VSRSGILCPRQSAGCVSEEHKKVVQVPIATYASREWTPSYGQARAGCPFIADQYQETRLSVGKLTGVFETIESHLSILADLDEVAVGITHVAAPFSAVIVHRLGKKNAPLSRHCL
jgi:hypothetical protein